MRYFSRSVAIFSGLLLFSIACSLTGSLGASKEAEEKTILITPLSDSVATATLPPALPAPTPTSETSPVTPQIDSSPPDDTSSGDTLPATLISASEAATGDCQLNLDLPPDSSAAGGGGAAPVAPNQTLLKGTVRCVWEMQASTLNIQPEMPIYIAEVEIVEANDVAGFMNQLTGQAGQIIKIFSKTPIPPDAAGQTIEVQVAFSGDETGGNYWVVGDQLSVAQACQLDLPPASSAPGGGGAAPVAPNQTLLKGTIGCVWEVQASTLNIQPEMPIYIAEVEIVEANDVAGFMNQLTGQTGQTIKIFSKTPIPPDVSGQTIEVEVAFRGDETGGNYWVVGDQLSIQ